MNIQETKTETLREREVRFAIPRVWQIWFHENLFEMVAIATKKPPTYTLLNDQEETIHGKFFSKRVDQSHSTVESCTIELVSTVSVQLFPDRILSSFKTFFYWVNRIWRGKRKLQFRKCPTYIFPKLIRWESPSILIKNSQLRVHFTVSNLFFIFLIRMQLKRGAHTFKSDTILLKTVSQFRCLRKGRKLRFKLQLKNLVLHSFVRTWDLFRK